MCAWPSSAAQRLRSGLGYGTINGRGHRAGAAQRSLVSQPLSQRVTLELLNEICELERAGRFHRLCDRASTRPNLVESRAGPRQPCASRRSRTPIATPTSSSRCCRACTATWPRAASICSRLRCERIKVPYHIGNLYISLHEIHAAAPPRVVIDYIYLSSEAYSRVNHSPLR